MTKPFELTEPRAAYAYPSSTHAKHMGRYKEGCWVLEQTVKDGNALHSGWKTVLIHDKPFDTKEAALAHLKTMIKEA